ncbi:unnamed protein product [Brassica oleracea var. botrytis]|uniref:Uncharacterized protein n=1 Tax=Brassica oleracea TaxID=3712 RepID=A0A3P6CIX4_BRAOL|nr:unnamed protein product [Brassica oleracea]
MSALTRLAPLSIHEPTEHSSSGATMYVAPGPLIKPSRVVTSNINTEMDVDMSHGPNLDAMVLTETDLENLEKSVKEFENLEMDDDMIANDDLLRDIPGLDAVHIDALTQFSPVHAEIQDPLQDGLPSSTPERRSAEHANTVMSQEGIAAKPSNTQARKPICVMKRNVPKSPDAKGVRASRKLNAAREHTSQKVKKGITSSKSPIPSSHKLPRIEVYPSALSKNSLSLSGSVVSQKPPSKRS